jgi:O-acetyl-ADP-ribose deacetylase (regulator of RNase III)
MKTAIIISKAYIKFKAKRKQQEDKKSEENPDAKPEEKSEETKTEETKTEEKIEETKTEDKTEETKTEEKTEETKTEDKTEETKTEEKTEETKTEDKTEETKTEEKTEEIKDCIEIINSSFIKGQFEKNTVIIDPAGSAFTNGSTTYNGGAGSDALYKYLKITNKKHNLSPINTGEAKINNELDYKNYNNIVSVIHAVGPNDSSTQYFDDLKKTINSINEEINKLPNNNYNIRLPLISAGLYSPTDFNLEDYFKKYIPYVKDILCKNNKIKKIYLALYKQEERTVYEKVKNQTGGKIDKIIENMVNEYNNKKVKKYKIVKKLN